MSFDRLSRARGTTLLAWSLVAFIAASVVATVILHPLNGGSGTTVWWATNVVDAFILGVAGVVLVSRRSSNPLGWLFLVGAVGQGLTGAGREWLLFSQATSSHRLAGGVWAGWIGTWAYVPAFLTLPLALLVLPDGQLLSRRWRWLLGVVAASGLVLSVGLATSLGPLDESLPEVVNPVGMRLGGAAETAVNWSMNVLMLALLAAIASLVLRYRRAEPDARPALKWVVIGGSIQGIELLYETGPWPNGLGPVVGPIAVVLFATTVVVTVLRYRVDQIDSVVSRSASWATLTGGLVLGYLAVVGALDEALTHVGASVVATALVAVAFAPARSWLQRGADRLVFGHRRDPYAALSALSGQLADGFASTSLLEAAAQGVASAMRLPYVAVASGGGDCGEVGARPERVHVVALEVRGEIVGHLTVGTGPARELTRSDARILGDLSRQVALAVAAVKTNDDLVRSRQALVTAREEERFRIHRDLHDGLGPSLAAVSMKVEAARSLVPDRPDEAVELLGRLKGEVRATIDDVRRVVYHLRPPALDELGLGPALIEASAALSYGCVLVHVDVPADIGPLPPAVEVAAYHIATEGLTNVARHAGATHAWLRLVRNGALEVTVDDDGGGLPVNWQLGVGTQSMRDRADELGGSCTIGRSPAGGTRVTAVLPTDAP